MLWNFFRSPEKIRFNDRRKAGLSLLFCFGPLFPVRLQIIITDQNTRVRKWIRSLIFLSSRLYPPKWIRTILLCNSIGLSNPHFVGLKHPSSATKGHEESWIYWSWILTWQPRKINVDGYLIDAGPTKVVQWSSIDFFHGQHVDNWQNNQGIISGIAHHFDATVRE